MRIQETQEMTLSTCGIPRGARRGCSAALRSKFAEKKRWGGIYGGLEWWWWLMTVNGDSEWYGISKKPREVYFKMDGL